MHQILNILKFLLPNDEGMWGGGGGGGEFAGSINKVSQVGRAAGSVQISLNHSVTNFKKWYAAKNIWMWYSTAYKTWLGDSLGSSGPQL